MRVDLDQDDFRNGSNSEVARLGRHFRSTPENGHRQATPTCPFRAKKRQGQVDDYIAKLTDVTLSPENGGRLPCLIVAFTDAQFELHPVPKTPA